MIDGFWAAFGALLFLAGLLLVGERQDMARDRRQREMDAAARQAPAE